MALTHAEAHPGQRVVDLFSDRIVYDITHPPKHDNSFPAWLADFQRRLRTIQNTPHTVTGFTDGSVIAESQSKSAAAYRIYRGEELVKRRAFSCGKSTVFDAEMFALAAAIGATTTVDTTHIHLFTDNVGAIQAILNPSKHPSQSTSIAALQRLRPWLQDDPTRTITLHWCPSHVGVVQNEAVDLDAKHAARTTTPTRFRSYAFIRMGHRLDSMAEWRKLTQDRTYRGHQFLCGRGGIRPTDKPNKQADSVLSLAGTSNTMCARMSRTILNHAPTGEFRAHFFPREAQMCPTCGVRQTRRHILNSCRRYQRRGNDFLRFLKDSAEPGSLLHTFLSQNPSAFTFDDAPD